MTDRENKAIEVLKQYIEYPYEVVCDDEANIILNLIEELNGKVQEQEKVIHEMAKEINRAYYDECSFYLDFEKNIIPDGNGCISDRIAKLKQYFYRKVENNE